MTEQLSLDILDGARNRVTERSGDGTISGREHKYKPVVVKEKGVGTEEEKKREREHTPTL